MAQNQVIETALAGIMSDAAAGSLTDMVFSPYTARAASPAALSDFTLAVSVTPISVTSLGDPVQRPDGSIGFVQTMVFDGSADAPNTCVGLVAYSDISMVTEVIAYSDFDGPYPLPDASSNLPVVWQLTLDLTNGNFGQVEVN